MMKGNLLPGALALLACCAMAACGRGDAAAQTSPAKTYERPEGWSSECFGRFLIDAPGELKFGVGDENFRRGKVASAFMQSKDSPFEGWVGVSSNVVRETAAISRSEFGRVWQQANGHHKIDLVRDGGPEWEMDARQRASERLQLPDDAFIWRYKTQFDFGTFVQADMRARMLHGELSGQGSLAQAKAVVDALWPRYRPRRPGELPNAAGICTPYGFFADPPALTERDYELSFEFPDARHSNFVVHLGINTVGYAARAETIHPPRTPIEQWPTPWEQDAAQAAKSKRDCKAKQPTSTSRDMFGCMFAGARDIKSHRPVQYLTLQSGQRARLLVYELNSSWNDGYEYVVRLQAQGQADSALQPNIDLAIYGIGPDTAIPTMRGKKPPPVDEAIATARTMAASLRLRPGAVAEGAPVRDTLEGVR